MVSALAAALTAVALLPAAAQAGTVTGLFGSYTYTDVAGNETNDLVVTNDGDDLVFADPAGVVDDSTECEDTGATVTCNSGFGSYSVSATLAGGNDTADLSAAELIGASLVGGDGDDELTTANVFSILYGDGDDDTLRGGSESDILEGGDGVDNLAGGGGFDSMVGGAGADELDGGAERDTLRGDAGDDVLRGGDGADELFGGEGADTLSGGGENQADSCGDEVIYSNATVNLTITLDGIANDVTGDGDTILGDVETIEGGDGDDSLTGSEGDNCLDGGAGNDVLAGLGGADNLDGEAGVDTMDGGTGDDSLSGDDPESAAGGDVYIGGDGVDSAEFPAMQCDASFDDCQPRDLTITLDGQPNDGAAGENDDVRGDVEDVFAFGSGNVTIIGNAAFNVIGTEGEEGGGGNDVVDPGSGSDSVGTADGDDTVNARDGFADRIWCGPGAGDVANVDQLDVTLECETVNRETVAVGLEDLVPAIDLVFPAAAARLNPNRPTVLRANATDDRGVQRVLFMDDERVVCNDDAAPFECAYQPRANDVGRNTLMAVAIDSVQQAAFVTREVTVSKFTPAGLSIGVTPRRDQRAPRRFTVSGRLRLPAALGAAQGCRGFVRITVRSGGRTIASRRVRLSRRCRYAVRIRVNGERNVTVRARFGGNDVARARRSSAAGARSG